MAMQRIFHDGETEARAAALTRPADIYAIEPLGKSRDMFLLDADSRIRD